MDHASETNSKPAPLTFLCLASYEKGHRTLAELKSQGCRVILLTSLSLKDKAKWPAESFDEIFYMPDQEHAWNIHDMLLGVSYLARTNRIDRIMALDDFDVEKAAVLREHLRLPGMGESGARHFRDKLAMRIRAARHGILVPEFSATFNYEAITRFLNTVPGPWVLKPRLMAGAIGIRKFSDAQAVWDRIHGAGDEQANFVLERFVPGDIFHVDSIWFGHQMVFAVASAYGTPPLELISSGGVFTTQLVERGSEIDAALREANRRLLEAFELKDGVSHTEFIRAHEDGRIYFLETSARVGGAHIAELLEHATGINLWQEWARVEICAASGAMYHLPVLDSYYAGLLVSLAREEWPDLSNFTEPELVWRLEKRNHVGLIVKSAERLRVEQLLGMYLARVRNEYLASAPAPEKMGQ